MVAVLPPLGGMGALVGVEVDGGVTTGLAVGIGVICDGIGDLVGSLSSLIILT